MSVLVEVRVPATTANLGPGFDCLGLALDLWNRVTLERRDTGVRVVGEGQDTLERGPGNLVYRAAASLLRRAGEPVEPLGLLCENQVPLARGLGSSAAAVVGGLVAANALCPRPLSQRELLQMAAEVEGHPDNAAPALLGGCQVVTVEGQEVTTSRVALPPGLSAVMFIPDQPLSTAQARAVLPRVVDRADAVFNVSRAALLVNALATGDTAALALATQDRLHQPYRGLLFPAMASIIRAAMAAGALGAFLSGAGPTVLALARGREVTIGYEMEDAAARAGVGGHLRVVGLSEAGAHVVAAS